MIVKPTSKIRRASSTHDNECRHNRNNTYFCWGCEREEGHKGPHLAWADYTTGQLYEGGCWNDADETIEVYPEGNSSEGIAFAFYVSLHAPKRYVKGTVNRIELPDGRTAYLRVVSHGNRTMEQALRCAARPRPGETLLNTYEM